jgi:KDO2-lipid IV(A) lauroyltransferase
VGKSPSEHTDCVTRQQRRWRNVRRRLLGWLAAPTVALLRHLPLAVLRPTLRMLFAAPMYLMNRRAAFENITTCLGDRLSPRERRRLAWRSCEHLSDALAESLVATRKGIESLRDRLDDDDARRLILQFERDHPHGWIGVTGHIGNWELLAHWTAVVSRTKRTLVVAKRAPNPHLNVIIERLRARLRLDTMYQDESPARAIRALRAGQVLGVVPDQDVKTISGMFIDFFGRPAFTPIGPARISIASGCPLICLFFLRKSDGTFHVQGNPPIEVDATMPRDEQVAALTRAWSRQVEDVIRRYPEQWPWIHNRWKTTPQKLAERGRKPFGSEV